MVNGFRLIRLAQKPMLRSGEAAMIADCEIRRRRDDLDDPPILRSVEAPMIAGREIRNRVEDLDYSP